MTVLMETKKISTISSPVIRDDDEVDVCVRSVGQKRVDHEDEVLPEPCP